MRRLLALALFAPALALAEPPAGDRPSEDDLFGSEPAEPAAPTTPDGAEGTPGATTTDMAAEPQDSGLDDDGTAGRLMDTLGLTNDTLQIGGLVYLRPQMAFVESDQLEHQTFSMPNLLEVYMDARPNDRLRAYIRGRLTYDPTVDEDAKPAFTLPDGVTLPPALGAFVGNGSTDSVSAALTQLWLNFDIERRVYITIGKQAIRWGATRIWNPVDVINPSRRNALNVFDDRSGVGAIKVHVPVESLGWNFYLLGLLDEVTSLERAGVAGRAEFVLGPAEIGVTAAYRHHGETDEDGDGRADDDFNGDSKMDLDLKAGLDFSVGVWDLDITGEVGLTSKNEPDDQVPLVQVAGGLQYGVQYNDEDVIYFGLEYFYNQAGAGSVLEALESPSPWIAPSFLYLGKHYGGFTVAAVGPGSWDDSSFTLSTVGNFSDNSFISRLDASVKVLTYLTVQMFVQVSYGEQGELHFGSEVFGTYQSLLDAVGVDINTVVGQAGVWLRLDI